MSYQAIPADCGLIELARSEIELGEQLSLVPYWFSRAERRPSPGREADGEGRLWACCCQLACQHPDLYTQNCVLDRRWDKLHYLLSASRRDEPTTSADLAMDRAFHAGELIAEHVRACQGAPVRYLSPTDVREVAATIGPMSHDSLAEHYHPARMEAAGVYKFWADRADEAEWRWIASSFDEFRSFFLSAAVASHGVIVVLD